MHFTVTAEIEILHNRFPRHIQRCMFWRCCCFPQVRHEDEGKCLSLLFFLCVSLTLLPPHNPDTYQWQERIRARHSLSLNLIPSE